MDAYLKEKTTLARALDKASTALLTEAKRLRDLAEAHRRGANQWEQLNKNIATAPHLVEWLRVKGSKDPIGQAAEMIGVLPDFIEAHYKYFLNGKASRTKRQRNREIIRLARTLTNGEIGARTGVSISTVKRVLRADDQGDYSPPPDLARRKKVRLKPPLPPKPD